VPVLESLLPSLLTLDAAVIIGSVILSSFVHGFVGFGFGSIAMMFFVIFSIPLERAAATITLMTVPVIAFLWLVEMKKVAYNRKQILVIITGIALGTPIGYRVILLFGHTAVFRLAFGMTLVLFSLHGILGSGKEYTVPAGTGPLFGFLGGLTGGAFVAAGPPVMIYLYGQEGDPRNRKGVLQFTLLFASFMRIASIGVDGGGFAPDTLGLAVILMPVTILLIWAGNRVSRQVSIPGFRQAVYLTTIVLGLSISAQSLYSVLT
jgi:uncharacterized membrane protein YfcA